MDEQIIYILTKGSSIYDVRNIFYKTNVLHPLIRQRMRIRGQEKFAYVLNDGLIW